MNSYFVWLATSAIIGVVCAIVAKKYQKDPLIWFIIGFALNVLVLAAVVAAKGLKAKKTADTQKS